MTEVTTPQPTKLALCIDAVKFEWYINGEGNNLLPIGVGQIEAMETRLIDRAICEKDESTLQLLPYNVLINEDGKVFRYIRGGNGEEARLHGKYSIGVGGHVDIAPLPKGKTSWGPDEVMPNGFSDSLNYTLCDEAAREIREEVGLTGPCYVTFTHYLMDYTNPVGRVHLGLLSVNVVNSANFGDLEEGMIENGEWVEIEDLFKTDEEFARLENWSQSTAEHLYRLKHTLVA